MSENIVKYTLMSERSHKKSELEILIIKFLEIKIH